MKHKAYKYSCIYYIIFYLLYSVNAVAANMEVYSCEDYNCLLTEFTQEEPITSGSYHKGSYRSYISKDCHFNKLDDLFYNSVTTSELGQALTNKFQDCEAELSRFNSNAIVSMYNMRSINYYYDQNPRIQLLEFTYDENTKVQGILALKDDLKRPLVIVKNGVFGNAEDTATVRKMLMHLSEESPFHVLVLGNLTGDDFIKENGFIAMGGFEEGRQIHKVIEILMNDNSVFKDQIYDIHMLGISLGGNAALFSSLYNEYIENEDHKIKSHIAYCPVVNLEDSINHVYRSRGIGIIFSFITKRILENLFYFIPDIWDLFNPDEKIKNRRVHRVLTEGAIRSIKERTLERPWDAKPFEGVQVDSHEDFWYLNNFLNFSNQINNPLMVLHSSNDFVVKSSHNANPLRVIASENTNIGFVNLNHGGHCAFSMSYGWPNISRILKNYILKNSSFDYQAIDFIGKISYQKSPIQNPRFRFVKYQWDYNVQNQRFEIEMRYRVDHWPTLRGNARCREQDYRFSDSACYHSRVYSLNESMFSSLGIHPPETMFEVAKLVRWLNVNLYPTNINGEIPYGKGESPTHFRISTRWSNY